MKMQILLFCTVALSTLTVLNAFATRQKPIDVFISQVKETNTLVPVTSIWQVDKNFDKTAMLQKVEQAVPLTINYTQVANLIQQNTFAISLVIPSINGGSYTIDLAQYKFLSNDFQVHALGANNADGIINYTPGLYYQGVVEGIPGSIASFSFFNNEVYGIFSIPGEGNYNLVPNIMVGKYYNSNTHYVLYNDNQLKIKDMGPGCDQDKLPAMDNPAARTTTTLGNDVYNNCVEVRVFEVGDYALYQTKGSSSTNVMNYLTSLFNNQNLLYRNEGIPTVLKYVQIDTITDAYQNITSTSATSAWFLDTFGHVTQNTLHGCDLAILASTAMSGGYGALGGVAWLQAMCQPYQARQFFGPYAFCDLDNSGVTNFPTFSWDVEVMTHEMGHVVGSPHTHRCCWNPPGTGTTAIDGCYTLEGTCAIPSPAYPVGGGTIMSYCHLTSDGINFSNGFGTQPGDTVRYFLSHTFSSSCGAAYNPSTAISKVNRVLSANRECTDGTSGITYYWNDNSTADQTDDTLVLMIKKNGSNIGTLDSTGFAVSSGTIAAYGSGSGQVITFPSGTSGVFAHSVAMRRYWKITSSISTVSTAVEVMFPFMTPDTSDVDGSVPGAALPLTGYEMYKVKSPVDPNPANGFTGATGSSFSIYTYGTTASATNWSFSNIGTTNLAHILTTNVAGGGTLFYPYNFPIGIANIQNADDNVYVYPNPTSDQWLISVSSTSGSDMNLQLYSSDGKLIHMQTLQTGSINKVEATTLPVGIYFYRIIGNENTYTGSLLKK